MNQIILHMSEEAILLIRRDKVARSRFLDGLLQAIGEGKKEFFADVKDTWRGNRDLDLVVILGGEGDGEA